MMREESGRRLYQRRSPPSMRDGTRRPDSPDVGGLFGGVSDWVDRFCCMSSYSEGQVDSEIGNDQDVEDVQRLVIAATGGGGVMDDWKRDAMTSSRLGSDDYGIPKDEVLLRPADLTRSDGSLLDVEKDEDEEDEDVEHEDRLEEEEEDKDENTFVGESSRCSETIDLGPPSSMQLQGSLELLEPVATASPLPPPQEPSQPETKPQPQTMPQPSESAKAAVNLLRCCQEPPINDTTRTKGRASWFSDDFKSSRRPFNAVFAPDDDAATATTIVTQSTVGDNLMTTNPNQWDPSGMERQRSLPPDVPYLSSTEGYRC